MKTLIFILIGLISYEAKGASDDLIVQLGSSSKSVETVFFIHDRDSTHVKAIELVNNQFQIKANINFKGILYNIHIDRKSNFIYYCYVLKGFENNSYLIEKMHLLGGYKEVLCRSNAPIISVAYCENNLYFVCSSYYNKNSPAFRSTPKAINIYSLNLINKSILRLNNFDARSFFGALLVDDKEMHLYMCLQFTDEYRNNGPYRFNLQSGELQYLLPDNFKNVSLYRSSNNGLNKLPHKQESRFLLPIPMLNNILAEYLLVSTTDIYKVVNNSGSIIYQSSLRDSNKEIRIVSTRQLHGMLAILKSDSRMSKIVYLDNSYNIINTYVINGN